MSAHFTIAELCASNYATRHRIDNRPPSDVAANLLRMIEALELIRSALGDRPVIVTSGYRCPALNQAVGGSRRSAHMEGRAADIKVVGLSAVEVSKRLRDAKLPLDQLIHEGTWTHVAIPHVGIAPRGDVLTARFTSSGVHYVQGIVL